MWRVRGSVAGRDSSVPEGQRWREGGGIRGGVGGMGVEDLHVETGEGVGNNVMNTWDVLCRHVQIMLSR